MSDPTPAPEPTPAPAPKPESTPPPEPPKSDKPAPPWGSDEEFNPEKAWNLIQNLRGDIEKLKPQAAKAKELEDAKLTEQQRLEKERDEVKESLTKAQADLLRERIGRKYGLDDEVLDDLNMSGTPEDIDARAKRVAERLGADKKAPPSQKPKERLRGGSDPNEDPEPDMRKVVDSIERGF